MLREEAQSSSRAIAMDRLRNCGQHNAPLCGIRRVKQEVTVDDDLQPPASVIVVFSGGQLFALGDVGEYLARMHFRMLDRPADTVRKEADHPVRTGGPCVGS